LKIAEMAENLHLNKYLQRGLYLLLRQSKLSLVSADAHGFQLFSLLQLLIS
jgi:hypothetical protein